MSPATLRAKEKPDDARHIPGPANLIRRLTVTILPKFDLSRFYLGGLCKRGHDYRNTGSSLRSLSKRDCVDCKKLWSRINRKGTQLLPPEAAFRRNLNKLVKDTGFTLADYKQLLQKQDGKCAICKCGPPKGSRFCVDHCHESGYIRGLLCHSCNKGLGNFRDNQDYLKTAILYLEEAS